jgi:hypothetical protein
VEQTGQIPKACDVRAITVIESELEIKDTIRIASGSADKVDTCIRQIYNFFKPCTKNAEDPD